MVSPGKTALVQDVVPTSDLNQVHVQDPGVHSAMNTQNSDATLTEFSPLLPRSYASRQLPDTLEESPQGLLVSYAKLLLILNPVAANLPTFEEDVDNSTVNPLAAFYVEIILLLKSCIPTYL